MDKLKCPRCENEKLKGIAVKEYLVILNKDGTETKKLLKEIYPLPVPTIEEIYNEVQKRKRRITIICLLLYVLIIVIIIYFCFKF